MMSIKRALVAIILLSTLSLDAAQKKPKVCVIGAGVAGLTAAYELHKHNIDVEVFEARGRTGGRLFTAYIDGKIAELGGQNIHDGGKAGYVHELLHELGLKTISRPASMNPYLLDDQNNLVDINELLEQKNYQPESLNAQLKTYGQQSNTMQDVLVKLFDTSKIDDYNLYRFSAGILEGYEGDSVDKLAPDAIDTLAAILLQTLCIGNKALLPHTGIQGGSALLTEGLAAKLDKHVHLNMPLKAICKNTNGTYSLRFNNKNQHDEHIIQADIVVLAIPCTIYKEIAFGDGVIPSNTLANITSIPYGTNAKILVPPADAINPQVNLVTNEFASIFSVKNDLVEIYTIGDTGKFTQNDINSVCDTSVSELQSLYGYYFPSYEKATETVDAQFTEYDSPIGHSWWNDPYTQGSYAYVGVGQEKVLLATETVNGFQIASLFAPINNSIFFAGEHCKLPCGLQGTIQGAANSGYEAAQLVLAALNS